VSLRKKFWPKGSEAAGSFIRKNGSSSETSEEETSSQTQVRQKDDRMTRSMTMSDSPY
jgi:hypothetical protein